MLVWKQEGLQEAGACSSGDQLLASSFLLSFEPLTRLDLGPDLTSNRSATRPWAEIAASRGPGQGVTERLQKRDDNLKF